MLYLVMEHYDNGEICEDWRACDTVIGIYETKELAEKEIMNIVKERKEDVYTRNTKIEKQHCPSCSVVDRDTCTVCLNDFKKTKKGYLIRDFHFTKTYDYSVKEIELNKRIK